MKKTLLILLIPTIAFATVSDGPYIGLEAGLSNQIMLNSNYIYNNATDITTRLNIGYNFDKNNGLELAGNYGLGGNFNTSSGSTIPAQYASFDASYLINFPTTFNGFSIFGRLGGAYVWVNNNSSCNCTNNNVISGSDITDELGAGIKYNITSKTSFRLEWIENGLIFPVGISNSTTSASWTNQTFITGFNVSF